MTEKFTHQVAQISTYPEEKKELFKSYLNLNFEQLGQ